MPRSCASRPSTCGSSSCSTRAPSASRSCSSNRKSTTARTPPHFWDVDRSGGGVTMDMGCHAIEFFRWMLGKPRRRSEVSRSRLRPDGHVRPRRQDPAATTTRSSFSNSRTASIGPGRGKLDQARRHGRPRRGPRLARRRLRRPAARQRHRDLQHRRLRLRGRKGRLDEGLVASRSTRRSGTTASRRRWRTSSIACRTTSSRS